MAVMLAPVVDGKTEAWRAWAQELMGPKKKELEDLNRRHGLTRHAAWCAETPNGPAIVVLHEGPKADAFMENLAKSDHEFDAWFRSKVTEIHGIDFSAPPSGPMPELVIDSGQ
jgi:hypothetical protein